MTLNLLLNINLDTHNVEGFSSEHVSDRGLIDQYQVTCDYPNKNTQVSSVGIITWTPFVVVHHQFPDLSPEPSHTKV